VNLVRLARHQHPRPPHQELRQKMVFDSGGRIVGTVENLYVDDDRELRFVDVVTSGFLGLGKKHHLVPVEAIANEAPGSITLGVDQQAVEGAPTFPDPHAGPDEELQRATREHYGYG
jgi:PRC-barrel domain